MHIISCTYIYIIHIYIYIYTVVFLFIVIYTYIYIYRYIHVCVCGCVWSRLVWFSADPWQSGFVTPTYFGADSSGSPAMTPCNGSWSLSWPLMGWKCSVAASDIMWYHQHEGTARNMPICLRHVGVVFYTCRSLSLDLLQHHTQFILIYSSCKSH